MKSRIMRLLSEKSTYAGAISFLSGAGVLGMGAEEWQAIFAAIAAVSGAYMMITLEKGDEEQNEPVE